MIYYCSIYSANMSSTNALQVARTDIQSGEKTESLSKLKLSTWWPIHAHANTYARLGSGAPQSAQMQFSLFCNNSFISFAIFAGRQRWMWVDNISETAMTLISKKMESLEGKNYICIFGSSCVHYHEHICVCSRLVQNIPVRAPGNYATPLHEKAIYAYLRSQYHHVHSSWVQESAGRSPITRRRIANRKSTQHQLPHAIQHQRN